MYRKKALEDLPFVKTDFARRLDVELSGAPKWLEINIRYFCSDLSLSSCGFSYHSE